MKRTPKQKGKEVKSKKTCLKPGKITLSFAQMGTVRAREEWRLVTGHSPVKSCVTLKGWGVPWEAQGCDPTQLQPLWGLWIWTRLETLS